MNCSRVTRKSTSLNFFRYSTSASKSKASRLFFLIVIFSTGYRFCTVGCKPGFTFRLHFYCHWVHPL